MKKILISSLASFALLLTSCDTFYEGMAAGYGRNRGYGGYGYGMYNPYASPIGVLPYWLQPDVYAANAAEQAKKQVAAQQKQMEQSARQAKANMPVVTSTYIPTTTSSSSSSSSSGSTTRSGSSSSSSKTPCPQCNGTGRMVYNANAAQFGTKYSEVYCSECGISYPKSWGHSHITCKICHGHKYI